MASLRDRSTLGVDYSRAGADYGGNGEPRVVTETPRVSGSEVRARSMGDFRKGVVGTEISLEAGSLFAQADDAAAAGLPAYAAELEAEAKALEQRAAAFRPTISSFTEVKDPLDAIDYLQGGTGMLLPTVAATVAGGAAGAIAGSVFGPVGTFIGGTIGAMKPAFDMESSEQASSQHADEYIMRNTTPEERIHERRVKAGINMLLEVAVPVAGSGKIINTLRRFGGKTVEETAKRSAGKTVATGVAAEGTTELAQTISGQQSLSRLNPERDTSEDYIEQIDSFILGALGGGIMLAPAAVLESVKSDPNTLDLDQAPQFIEDEDGVRRPVPPDDPQGPPAGGFIPNSQTEELAGRETSDEDQGFIPFKEGDIVVDESGEEFTLTAEEADEQNFLAQEEVESPNAPTEKKRSGPIDDAISRMEDPEFIASTHFGLKQQEAPTGPQQSFTEEQKDAAYTSVLDRLAKLDEETKVLEKLGLTPKTLKEKQRLRKDLENLGANLLRDMSPGSVAVHKGIQEQESVINEAESQDERNRSLNLFIGKGGVTEIRKRGILTEKKDEHLKKLVRDKIITKEEADAAVATPLGDTLLEGGSIQDLQNHANDMLRDMKEQQKEYKGKKTYLYNQVTEQREDLQVALDSNSKQDLQTELNKYIDIRGPADFTPTDRAMQSISKNMTSGPEDTKDLRDNDAIRVRRTDGKIHIVYKRDLKNAGKKRFGWDKNNMLEALSADPSFVAVVDKAGKPVTGENIYEALKLERPKSDRKYAPKKTGFSAKEEIKKLQKKLAATKDEAQIKRIEKKIRAAQQIIDNIAYESDGSVTDTEANRTAIREEIVQLRKDLGKKQDGSKPVNNKAYNRALDKFEARMDALHTPFMDRSEQATTKGAKEKVVTEKPFTSSDLRNAKAKLVAASTTWKNAIQRRKQNPTVETRATAKNALERKQKAAKHLRKVKENKSETSYEFDLIEDAESSAQTNDSAVFGDILNDLQGMRKVRRLEESVAEHETKVVEARNPWEKGRAKAKLNAVKTKLNNALGIIKRGGFNEMPGAFESVRTRTNPTREDVQAGENSAQRIPALNKQIAALNKERRRAGTEKAPIDAKLEILKAERKELLDAKKIIPKRTEGQRKSNPKAKKPASINRDPISAGTVKLQGRSPYTAKDQAKSDKANKFIGQGSQNSSTNSYRKSWGDRANSGKYTSEDVVFVSVEGNRRGRLGLNIAELKKAMTAGATIVGDKVSDRSRNYNIGERQLAQVLKTNGYIENNGVWTKGAKPGSRAPAAKSKTKPPSISIPMINMHKRTMGLIAKMTPAQLKVAAAAIAKAIRTTKNVQFKAIGQIELKAIQARQKASSQDERAALIAREQAEYLKEQEEEYQYLTNAYNKQLKRGKEIEKLLKSEKLTEDQQEKVIDEGGEIQYNLMIMHKEIAAIDSDRNASKLNKGAKLLKTEVPATNNVTKPNELVDGMKLPQFNFEWTTSRSPFRSFSSFDDLCIKCAGNIRSRMQAAGFKTVARNESMTVNVPGTKRFSGHYFIVVEGKNGKRYIVDDPQKYLLTFDDKTLVGKVLKTTFEPFAIEITEANLKKHYGVTLESVYVPNRHTERTGRKQETAQDMLDRTIKNLNEVDVAAKTQDQSVRSDASTVFIPEVLLEIEPVSKLDLMGMLNVVFGPKHGMLVEGKPPDGNTNTWGTYDQDNDIITIYADNVPNMTIAILTAWHELYHRGARQRFNKGVGTVIDFSLKNEPDRVTRYTLEMYKMLKKASTNPTVAAIVKQIEIQRGIVGALAVEEALVELGAAVDGNGWWYIEGRYEIKITPTMRGELTELWRDFVDALLNFVGLDSKVTSDGEVLRMLKSFKEGQEKPYKAITADEVVRTINTREYADFLHDLTINDETFAGVIGHALKKAKKDLKLNPKSSKADSVAFKHVITTWAAEFVRSREQNRKPKFGESITLNKRLLKEFEAHERAEAKAEADFAARQKEANRKITLQMLKGREESLKIFREEIKKTPEIDFGDEINERVTGIAILKKELATIYDIVGSEGLPPRAAEIARTRSAQYAKMRVARLNAERKKLQAKLVRFKKNPTVVKAIKLQLEVLEEQYKIKDAARIAAKEKLQFSRRTVDRYRRGTFKNVKAARKGNKALDAAATKGEKLVKKMLGDFLSQPIDWFLHKKEGGSTGVYSAGTQGKFIRAAIDSMDPLSTLFHESMHALATELVTLKEGKVQYAKIAKLAMSPYIQKRLHSLLAADPDALAQIKEPNKSLSEKAYREAKADQINESVAYMFQFHSAGLLRIQPAARNTFKRWAQAFAKLIGYVTKTAAAEEIFTAFRTGDMSTIAGIQDTLTNMQHKRAMAAMESIATPLGKVMSALFLTPIDRLHKTKNRFLITLANKYSQEVKAGGKMGLLQATAMEHGRWLNRFESILQDHNATIKDVQRALRNLQAGRAKTKMELNIRDLFEDLYGYASKGVGHITVLVEQADGSKKAEKLQYTPNFFPRVWSSQAILENEAKLRKLLIHAAAAAGKPLSETDVTNFFDAVRKGEGIVDLGDATSSLTPAFSAANPRTFDFITDKNAHLFVEFQERDMHQIVSRYIRQVVHRREHGRTFGSNGTGVQKLLDAAKLAGATPEEMQMAENAIEAMDGTLGTKSVSTLQRNTMVTAMTVVNFAVLPLALFSSLVDPLGVYIRTGSLKAAGNTFLSAAQQVYNDTKGIKGNGQILAEYLGAIERSTMLEVIGQTNNGMFMNQTLHKANAFFFKVIGLEQWTRGTRIGALNASLLYLRDNYKNPKVLRELNLQRGDLNGKDIDVMAMPVGARRTRVEQALFRMVDESVLRPNSATRPIWMSDMRFILFGHLKQFTFTFHNVISKQVAKNFRDERTSGKNIAQASLVGLPLLSYVPVMIAADMVRAVVSGRSDDDDDDTFGKIMYDGVQRAGIMGLGSFLFDFERDYKYRKLPINTVLGPTVGKAYNLARTALNPRADFGKALESLAPGAALWKGWLKK